VGRTPEQATIRLGNGETVLVSAAEIPAGLASDTVVLSVRPEAIGIGRRNEVAGLDGTVTNRIFLGASAEYAVRVPGVGDILVTADHRANAGHDLIEPGEDVSLAFAPEAALVFPPSSKRGSTT
jgi:spermidine/putrescine transport system ATP-binding protein